MFNDYQNRLGDVIELLTDYHANGAYEKLKKNVTLHSVENYAVMIRTTNFEKNNFQENLIYVDEHAYNYLKKSKVYSSDLIMNKIANAGASYFMPKLNKPVSLGMNLFLIRINKNKADPFFIYSFLKKNELYVKSFASGSTTKTITKDDVRKLKIYLPPLPEQKKIANILSTWDKAIETIEKLIENSRAQKKALMQQLLTGKKRFAGFDGEWEEVKLSSLCDIRRGASPRPIKDEKWFAADGRGWIRIADVTAQKGQHLLSTTQYLSELGVEKSVSVDPGDLIMSICGTIGIPKFLGIKACIHDGFVIFRNISEYLNLNFLYQYLLYISEQLSASGQPGTQRNLNTTIVGNIMYPTIGTEEQQKIASVLTSADKEIELLEQQLSDLKQEKKALMQQLLTGKRRVTVATTSETLC